MISEQLAAPGPDQRWGERLPVSVVIPCFSCADTIERAVVSVMEQTALPAEVWLVEDGSTDEGRTLAKLYDLCERFSDETTIAVISMGSNQGPSVARNRAWDASSQFYVAFLDADDAWHPRKLELQYGWMREHPEVVLTGHRWPWVRGNEPFGPIPLNWRAWRVSPLRELLSNRFSTSTVMINRKLPYRFAEDDRLSHDFDLWMRIILDGLPAWRLELALTHIYKAQHGSGGLSKDLWPMGRSEREMYWRRVKEGRLRFGAFALLLPYLLLKFGRRMVIVNFRRLIGVIRRYGRT